MVGVSKTRGHRSNVRGNSFIGHMNGIFFTQRMINVWNTLIRTGSVRYNHYVEAAFRPIFG